MPKESRSSARVGREAKKSLLRLPDELYDYLRREASLNGRSFNSEVIVRLERSRLKGKARGMAAEEPPAEYAALTDMQRAMLAVFNSMKPEKQLALLSLFQ